MEATWLTLQGGRGTRTRCCPRAIGEGQGVQQRERWQREAARLHDALPKKWGGFRGGGKGALLPLTCRDATHPGELIQENQEDATGLAGPKGRDRTARGNAGPKRGRCDGKCAARASRRLAVNHSPGWEPACVWGSTWEKWKLPLFPTLLLRGHGERQPACPWSTRHPVSVS